MKTKLQFVHPIHELTMSHTNIDRFWSDPPDLFLPDSDGCAQQPYMPSLAGRGIEVCGKLAPIPLEDGRSEFRYQLNQEPPELWQITFENHRGAADAAFEGSTMVIRCRTDQLEMTFDELANGALYGATNDYRRERFELVFSVYQSTEERMRIAATKFQIEDEMKRYREKVGEIIELAKSRGSSITSSVEKFKTDFKENLEKRFAWWSKILDDGTICRYRAAFANEIFGNLSPHCFGC